MKEEATNATSNFTTHPHAARNNRRKPPVPEIVGGNAPQCQDLVDHAEVPGPVEASRVPHGARLRPAARVLRSLELGNPGRGQDQDDKSRMAGDCHVRTCGSPG
jgi:hypothetical protein